MDDWTRRIPAAIEKGKGLFPAVEESEQEEFVRADYDEYRKLTVTKTEVVLAEALWDMTLLLLHGKPPSNIALVPPALIAFTKKIESL